MVECGEICRASQIFFQIKQFQVTSPLIYSPNLYGVWLGGKKGCFFMSRRGLPYGFLSHWHPDSYWACCRRCGRVFVSSRFIRVCEGCRNG